MQQHPLLIPLLKRLWKHISARRRFQFALLLMLTIAASFAEVLSIGAVLPFLGVLTAPDMIFAHPTARPLIEVLGLERPDQLLLPLTVAFSVAALFSGGMRLLLLWVQTRMGHAIGVEFSIEIYRRTLYQPYSTHLVRNSSEVIAGITAKTSVLVNNTVLPVLTIVSSSMMLVAILVALIIIDPVIAIGAFAGFGLIYMVVIGFTKRSLARDSKRISRESTQVIKALQEGLGGIRDVLLDGTQAAYCKIYRNADLPLRRAQANVQIVSSSPRFGIEALAMILIAWLAYVLAGNPEGIANAIPVLGALALGAQRLLPVLQQIYLSMAAMRGGQASLSDALDLLDQPLPCYVDEPVHAPLPFDGEITLKGLGYHYAADAPPVLQEIDLCIPKGSRIGFIGTTGSGKSTLLDVVMGLLEPSEGLLLIDGAAVTDSNRRAWQAHIAHVPQTIFLADATIAENIAFGVPSEQIDHEQVRRVAVYAQIAETIETLPEQYQTMTGEGGVRLSGGQRQRIGIARALYKRADVIVLDEATSALDNDTERSVMEAIGSLGSGYTILMVAHRLSTLTRCDCVVELDQGRIRRTGSYSQITGLCVE
ncbi:MAG: ABC transporter ATP-binding protein [Sedimenticola thiotaurini]|uniref:ABC transporter ATP-binding protein n=1 Tax=Sedimenticola thiotaurini TaxID=1543721 RepID=A0A558DAU6_9GAMM|nr:MAG: ABC transporter ATP-binding protein [Sedimenticola thiotaurini]